MNEEKLKMKLLPGKLFVLHFIQKLTQQIKKFDIFKDRFSRSDFFFLSSQS